VVMLQKRWKQPGSSLLFSVSLYLVVRFAVEFFKDPVALAPGGAMAGMLNQLQWGILVFLPGLLFFLVLREKKSKPVSSPEPAALPSAPAIASFLALSVLLIVLLSAWFQPMETGMIFLFFTLAAGMAVRHIFSTYKQTGYRLMYAVFLIIPFILMGQTLPRQIGDSVKVRRSTSVGLGIGTGSYDNSVERFSGEGCDGIRNTAYFNQKYLLGGASLNFKNENITRRAEWNYGVDAILGKHTESLIRVDSYPPDTVAGGTPLPDPERKTIFSISPYFSYDARWAGIGGGLHIGQMSYAFYYQEEKGYGIPPTGRKVIHFFPRAYLRFGPRDIAFMDYHLASHFPSAWPGYLHMIGLGTGFGISDGAVLRVGTLYGGKDYGGDWDFLNTQLNGFYATGMVPLKNGITLEPLFLFSSSEAESNMNIQFSVGLRYELGHKMVTRAVMPF